MDYRELVSRIDRHLERGNELFDRNTKAMDRNTQAFERNNAEILGLRHFAQDLLARFQNLADDMRTVLHEQAAAMREQATAMRKQGKAMEDLGAEAKAHEQTLLFILDELKALRSADGTA